MFVLFWAVIHFPFDMALMSNKVKLKTYSEVVVRVHVVYCAKSSLILFSSLVPSSVCALFCRYIDLKNMRRLSQTTSWKNFTRDFLFSQCERDLNEMTSRSIPVRCASSRCRCSTSFRRVRETSGLSRHAHTLQKRTNEGKH